MARPGTQRRRVSHLVGRFEQLGSQPSETDGQTSRPTSKHSNSSPPRQAFFLSSKRSVSASDHSWEAKLADETSRLSEVLTECEALRKRCQNDEESLQSLKQKLEQEELARQGYEARHKLMEEELQRLQQQLNARDQEEKTRSIRAAAAVAELQEQWARSEEGLETEVQRQHDMLAIKLQDAESRGEAALRRAQSFERQTLELKQSMAASTRTMSQVTDQQIGEKMSMLNHGLQNWVVHVFRKVKIGKCIVCRALPALQLMSTKSIPRKWRSVSRGRLWLANQASYDIFTSILIRGANCLHCKVPSRTS